MAIRVWSLLFVLATGSAMAEGQPPAMCFSQCSAASPVVSANPPSVQACLIRCRAGAEFNASNRRGPQQAMRGIPLPPAAAQQPARSASASSPVARMGNASASMASAAVGAAAMATVSGGVAAPPSGQRWAAIYAAAPPATAVGVSQGLADRTMVHVRAETECRARGQSNCRLLTEFSAGCGAAAQATRVLGLLPTGDSSTQRVSFIAAGTGANRADAERSAVSLCNSRDPSATCRVVASACVAG
jgi:hypothetical protein